MYPCFGSEGKPIFFGNGASTADAQHRAGELTGRYLQERKALAAIALTTNTSSLTAIRNDYSYEEVFSRQIEAIGSKGDVAIGTSMTGNSENVIWACPNVPSEHTSRIQKAYILLGHILCEIIEEKFASDGNIS